MYFPMFKNRQFENKIIREYPYLFSNNRITPIVEIIRVKNDVETIIKEYDTRLNSSYFIDFFTFKHEEYVPYTPANVEFSASLRDESAYGYLDLLLSTVESEKAMPVISIKKARGFLLDHNAIKNLIKELQEKKDSIAVRLEGRLFDDYFAVINACLRESDYFMFDIGNNNLDAFLFQLDEFRISKKNYISILLNSPRIRTLYNGYYEDEQYTKLINNNAAIEYKTFSFDGFGDYLGLKDELPNDGGRGEGSAHVLFYDHKNNSFFSVLNPQVKDGVRGFKEVVIKLNMHRGMLDSNNDCLAYKYMDNHIGQNGTYGSWGSWKYILMLRTLSEMKKVYK